MTLGRPQGWTHNNCPLLLLGCCWSPHTCSETWLPCRCLSPQCHINGGLSSHLRPGRRNLLTCLTIATSRPLDSISKTSTSCPCRRSQFPRPQRTTLPAGTSLPLVGASCSLPSSSNAHIPKPQPPSSFRAQLKFLLLQSLLVYARQRHSSALCPTVFFFILFLMKP